MRPAHKRLLLASLMLMQLSCNNRIQKKTTENIYETGGKDTLMNAAKLRAQETFVKFDTAFQNGHFDRKSFSIKVRFRYPAGNEYIWATEISRRNGQYWGLISDTPRYTTEVRFNERVKIDPADIADWLFGNDSVLHGGYTLRLIVSRMSGEDSVRHYLEFPYRIED
jgi:uncharacterized protein YegJ (DUF2314 family)